MNEVYNRREAFRIAQLSVCLSLFLTFSVATLGFSINLLAQPVFSIVGCMAKSSFGLSLLFGLLSILFGAWACVNRVKDFRLTASIARARSKDGAVGKVTLMQDKAKSLGQWTWRLFCFQLSAFGFQVLTLMLALLGSEQECEGVS